MNREERKEKIERLESTKVQLKTEFIGLDSIIDEIINSISSWYVTPEIINRPVIVSLWGMTGTGKSSVVKRLIDLLGLNENTIFFDCGECTNDNKDISNEICDALGLDTEEFNNSYGKSYGEVFVFDEFQYARSINDEGHEEIKSSLRPIWSLMDSGIIDLSGSYSWSFSQFCAFVDDLAPFAKANPDIPVVENKIKDPAHVKDYLENVGFIYSNRSVPGITCATRNLLEDDEDAATDEDPYREIMLLDTDRIKTILRKLNDKSGGGEGRAAIRKIMDTEWKLIDFSQYLEKLRNKMSRPKSVDCSNSLVFVIGNLDEAFQVADEMSPDMEADMFYDVTKRINISDIKDALKKRFRPEQIARLGNNLIKYPTLDKESFKKIIDMEINRICSDLYDATGINLVVEDGMKELLYCEGVFPTQGVRPTFTTIGAILTPYLSKIILGSEKRYNCSEISINAIGNERGFRADSAVIQVKYGGYGGGGDIETFTHKLQLGELRNPLNRKRRYICSVHEAGHGIVYAYMTGKAPDSIVSVSTDDGGFCSTYDKEFDREIRTREDIDSEVMISMAGYVAEEVIFEDDGKRLMGSGSDIMDAWNTLSQAAYNTGYFNNFLYGNHETDDGAQNGGHSSIDYEVEYYDGVEFTGEYLKLEDAIHKRFDDLRLCTLDFLEKEKKLIVKMALELGEKGSMTSEEFTELVRKYGKELTIEDMKEQREECDPKYYLETLMEEK